jgi:tetratricopeptide (TPR) repeat protein
VPAGTKPGSAHAHAPAPPPSPAPPAPAAPSCDGDPSISALLAAGEAGLQAGDATAAVAALRKVVYLDPDHAIAQFQLGLAFELQGESRQARRAFSVARAALSRTSAAAEAALEGYQIGELVRMIDHRLTRSPEP